ncbi:MAG: deoxyguanosinetriphosphate triphosphohydrolase [Firmicutes bacterium]|nr:deoxyguanosinetriphosphate triphosphohydrolase [Bacillota bacterium]
MNYTDILKEQEKQFLSPFATSSFIAEDRAREDDYCTLRTQFARDKDRIIHSKAFRRLKHKTQVFISPKGDHYRTRLTHTIEVAQIARSLARALRLNEDLTEAIALGHDLGHTPFGHCGENALADLTNGYFQHNHQSLRVVEVLERNFKGLNLTGVVRDGILNHRTSTTPATLEGKVVLLSDKIAYINHDIDDCIRAGFLSEADLPKREIKTLGKSGTERINNMVLDIVKNSYMKNFVEPTAEFKAATDKLRGFMFNRIYLNPPNKSDEQKAAHIVKSLYEYYIQNLDKLPKYKQHLETLQNSKPEFKAFVSEFKVAPEQVVVCDYISGFTDEFAIEYYKRLFVPSRFNM